MYGPQPAHPKHHLRFYIVLTTLVLGGVLLLLFINDTGDGLGLTSFSVKDVTSAANAEVEGPEAEEFFADTSSVEKAFSKELEQTSKEVDVELAFDRIPDVRKEAKITEMELVFDDLTTKINVNSDKLELSNLQEVSLQIQGFEGKIDFDEEGFSLDGEARSLSVNDVRLSSRGEIKISFDDLDYDSFLIKEIELNDLELDNGDGNLKVSEKLQYELEQDKVRMYFFNGRLSVSRDLDNQLDLEGVARGIMVSGALMNFNLR